jgi:hypothetical protein
MTIDTTFYLKKNTINKFMSINTLSYTKLSKVKLHFSAPNWVFDESLLRLATTVDFLSGRKTANLGKKLRFRPGSLPSHQIFTTLHNEAAKQ